MLTVEQARHIANTWRRQFSDEEAFNTSWRRYMELVKDQSPAGLEQWLGTDLQRDAVKAAGIVTEPLLPVRQQFALGEESSCDACRGKRYVRFEVSIDHPHFGKAVPCPRCGGPDRAVA